MSYIIEPVVQFKINSNNEVGPKCAQLVPCKIAYTGPAPVSSYFTTEKIQTPNGELDVSTFRGRLLFGHDAILPDGYKFYAAKKLKGSDQQVFQISASGCQSLRIWDVDAEACDRRESPAQRSLNFLKVAEDLAQSDTDEE